MKGYLGWLTGCRVYTSWICRILPEFVNHLNFETSQNSSFIAGIRNDTILDPFEDVLFFE